MYNCVGLHFKGSVSKSELKYLQIFEEKISARETFVQCDLKSFRRKSWEFWIVGFRKLKNILIGLLKPLWIFQKYQNVRINSVLHILIEKWPSFYVRKELSLSNPFIFPIPLPFQSLYLSIPLSLQPNGVHLRFPKL